MSTLYRNCCDIENALDYRLPGDLYCQWNYSTTVSDHVLFEVQDPGADHEDDLLVCDFLIASDDINQSPGAVAQTILDYVRTKK